MVERARRSPRRTFSALPAWPSRSPRSRSFRSSKRAGCGCPPGQELACL